MQFLQEVSHGYQFNSWQSTKPTSHYVTYYF